MVASQRMKQAKIFDGGILRQLRMRVGLTQTDLAYAARNAGLKKMSPQTVARHETGKAEPKASQLDFYATYFGASKNKFLKETEVANAKKKTTNRSRGARRSRH